MNRETINKRIELFDWIEARKNMPEQQTIGLVVAKIRKPSDFVYSTNSEELSKVSRSPGGDGLLRSSNVTA